MKVYKVCRDVEDKTKDRLVAVDRFRKRVYCSDFDGTFCGKPVADVEPEDVASRYDFLTCTGITDWMMRFRLFGRKKAWKEILENFMGTDPSAIVSVWDIKI